jgi:hypothetical protein
MTHRDRAGFRPALGLLFILVLGVRGVSADEWLLTQNLAVQRRPIGVSLGTRLVRSVPLYDARSGILWDTARIEVGIANQLTPAFDNLAAEVFLEPIAVFDIRVRVGARFAFDALGSGYAPLESYTADYENPNRLSYRSDVGTFVTVTPRLKAQVGPVVVLNAFEVTRFSFPTAPQTHHYEQLYDVTLRRCDTVWRNSSAALWSWAGNTDRSLLTGLELGATRVPAHGSGTTRVSGVAAYERAIANDGWTLSAAVVAGLYASHRYYDPTIDDLYTAARLALSRRF